jgi:gliding motility-associated-like protein
MFRAIPLCCALLVLSLSTSAQVDDVGSGRAMHFNGTNQYINLGNVYDDLTLPLTITAWVNMDPTFTGIAGIFTSQDNSPTYNGVQLVITHNAFFIDYGDGTGENDPNRRRGKSSSTGDLRGRWVHVTGVIRGATDMDLYVNGINIGGSNEGFSNLPMNSNFPGDVAKIGFWRSNGINFPFKGDIDEVTIWNRSLTQTEVRANMCKKLQGNETGLIGYWGFNETSGTAIADKSSKGYHGTMVNSPTSVYSGAPIGDASVLLYPANWLGNTLSLTEGTDNVVISDVIGTPAGAHIYVVRNTPSQTAGLDIATVADKYYGVFLAALDYNNSFDASYNAHCSISTRIDNSIATWSSHLNAFDNVSNRNEIIATANENTTVDLGADEVTCNFIPRLLTPLSDPTGFTFVWQDGSSGPSFMANDFGIYWVKVQGGCGEKIDSIVFVEKPENFEVQLGPDKVYCTLPPTLLTALDDPSGYTFTWQDGSHQSTFLASDFGTYWVKVEGLCHVSTDSILFVQQIDHIDVDLGIDEAICPIAGKVLRPLENAFGFDFTWQDGSKNATFEVKDYGTYWVEIKHACGWGKDSITFERPEPREVFVPNVFTPNSDKFNDLFIVDDQLLGSELKVFNRWGNLVHHAAHYQNDWDGGDLPNGVYFFLIKNECVGIKKGDVSIFK